MSRTTTQIAAAAGTGKLEALTLKDTKTGGTADGEFGGAERYSEHVLLPDSAFANWRF